MRSRLIIDGNAVYEVNEDCMRKRRMDKATENEILKNDRKYDEGQGELKKIPSVRLEAL